MPNEAKKTIVVAGDAAIDWFLYPVPARDAGENWRLHPSAHATVLPGGAFLLGSFMANALRAAAVDAEVVAPVPPGELSIVPPQQVIHSNAVLEFFKLEPSQSKRLRVKESLGYIGPAAGSPVALPVPADSPRPDILVLNDAGNGFRDCPAAWRPMLDSGAPLLVHKMSRPLAQGPLWDRTAAGQFPNRIVIVNADDLRMISGVDLSRSLSWERTAKDFVYQIQVAERLRPLQTTPFLVVLFDCDGAIVYRGGANPEATLVFDPQRLEGSFAVGIAGRMYGLTSAFTAALVARLAGRGLMDLEAGVVHGLGCTRALLEAGFVQRDETIEYPLSSVFSDDKHWRNFETYRIERPRDPNQPDGGYWRILDQKTRYTRRLVAEQLVRDGEADSLRGVPQGRFGKLATIDRREIEAYSAIRELLVEFLKNSNPKRPLSLAVFGPPGAGKSFGVTQVLQSIGAPNLALVTFNISQFQDYSDLVAAFHRVRDLCLKGHTAVVFFDEFDSALGGQPLGWLKSFLAPMQDGLFKEGGQTHPVGNAIFVFAGGTRPTFEEFDRTRHLCANQPGGFEDGFCEAKGPDFVSRLRGFINVMGPNRQGPADGGFIIRRGKLLRAMLQDNPKARGLFDSSGHLRIDQGVLRALLHVSQYRHGARSLEAILEMSRFHGKAHLDLAALPPHEQLNLHVDAEEFLLLAHREGFFSLLAGADPSGDSAGGAPDGRPAISSVVEQEKQLVMKAARLIHEDYVWHRRQEGTPSPTAVPFDQLPPEKQQSNIEAAQDIPRKLLAIQHGLQRVPPGQEPRTPDITDEEVEHLARLEHDRWCVEQTLRGIVASDAPIAGTKTSPYLKPYDELPCEIQQYDVQAIYRIPVVLRELGFEIFRMEEVEELDDPVLLARLARGLHEQYCAERRKEGDSPDKNPSLVDFDALSPDLQAANLDQAASIPRKLRRIGLGVRRVLPGADAKRLELAEQQVIEFGKLEHARWNWQKLLQGWRYAPGPKNMEQKTTPYLVPWKDLEEDIRLRDLQPVRLIPDLLQSAGYEAFPLS